jgi:uncharacterized membrane protein YphA (DoxX/SURF4 family)
MKRGATLAILLLRIFIGWHFLYEGLIKVFQADWSSINYLEGSVGFLSGLYHWMASNPGLVQVIDFLNVWGLILLGTGLFLGIFIRISAVSGILLLMLYYFAYPPFGDAYSTYGTTGHFWIINSNFIEAIALMIIYLYPIREFSLMKLIPLVMKKREAVTEPPIENMDNISKRREMIKGLAALPFFGGMMLGSVAKAKESGLDAISGSTIKLKEFDISDLKGELPKGRLGDLEFGRLIIGHNLIGGTTHTRDLLYTKQLFLRYNTEERVLLTYSLAEQAGINMANITINSIPILNKYKKRTGSNMMSMAQVHYDTKSNDKLSNYKRFMELGATTMYVMGVETDNLVQEGNLDPIHEAVEFVQSQGYAAGIAAHSVQSIIASENAGVNPDYYFKTLHHDDYWSATPREFREEFCMSKEKSKDHNYYHDNMWDVFPEQTVDVIGEVKVPIVGFKVLAAGALQAQDGFRYAFEKGADFICVGMFDYQIVEDVNVATEILNGSLNRSRPWYS